MTREHFLRRLIYVALNTWVFAGTEYDVEEVLRACRNEGVDLEITLLSKYALEIRAYFHVPDEDGHLWPAGPEDVADELALGGLFADEEN